MEYGKIVSQHWNLPNVKPVRLDAASWALPCHDPAQELKKVDIVVTVLMLTGRAVAPGAVPSLACRMGFGLFRANFVTCSFCIAYLPMCSLCNNGSCWWIVHRTNLTGKYGHVDCRYYVIYYVGIWNGKRILQSHGWSLTRHRIKSAGNGINSGLLLQQRTKPKSNAHCFVISFLKGIIRPFELK